MSVKFLALALSRNSQIWYSALNNELKDCLNLPKTRSLRQYKYISFADPTIMMNGETTCDVTDIIRSVRVLSTLTSKTIDHKLKVTSNNRMNWTYLHSKQNDKKEIFKEIFYLHIKFTELEFSPFLALPPHFLLLLLLLLLLISSSSSISTVFVLLLFSSSFSLFLRSSFS